LRLWLARANWGKSTMTNIDNINLIDRLANLDKGRSMVYHVGFLARDRGEAHWINEIAGAAWDAHLAGKVALTQRKLGDSDYEYIATGLRRRVLVPAVSAQDGL
jgi:hypothetical protein